MFDDDTYQYFIFSDDINWCKQVFGENELIEYIEGNDQYVDLHLMTLCDHNIIANSTFSWWGAWLNKKENIVISPKKWFGPTLHSYITDDLYPENWVII